jgi:saccharopine dehydrogenase-like NADP-dependent oxidoreductase
MTSSSNRRRVVFIGAAGEMRRLAIERFAVAEGDWELALYDIRPELLEGLVQRLPGGRATAARLDLYDREGLNRAVEGAALVVLGAGPYVRTSGPVVEACLQAKVPYLDFDDDVESTQHALSLHEKAQEAGIPIYVGCGASPGMTNVMVVDAARDFDSVENIDMFWVVGDERPGIGRAVLEHLLHIAAGPCLTWENGGPVMHQSWVELGSAPMGGGLGQTLMHETAHPEPVTLPRRYPKAKRIRCLGGLDPAPFNGIARGLGLAVQQNKMTVKAAVDFLEGLINNPNRLGSVKGWRHAISGTISQVRSGESTATELVNFLGLSGLRRTYPYRAGLLVQVTGMRDEIPAVATLRTPFSGPATYLFRDMAAVTGTACAAFMVLALDQEGTRTGSFAPEDWADPEAFYKALELVGVPRCEIIETV